MNPIITLESPRLQWIGVSLSNPTTTAIPFGTTVVIGRNGAGKSTLGRIIERGRNLATNRVRTSATDLKVTRLEFNDIHSLSEGKVTYMQQRFESSMNDEVPTVSDLLPRLDSTGMATMPFDMTAMSDKRINYLSSGETRKLLICRALCGQLPDLLILDNPYIGLDTHSKAELDGALRHLASQGVSVMLLVCDPADIPDYATAMLPLENMTVGALVTGTASELRRAASHLFEPTAEAYAPQLIIPPTVNANVPVVEMHACTVRYGSRTLLESVDWRIMPGERWVLSGPNGSGKSTLLSLICADGPQAYSNDISIFGRRRGTGESIWEVKRRIGYISPEMQLYFGGGSATVRDVVARGLNDTVGCYTRLSDEQIETAGQWIDALGMTHLADRTFSTLSTGQQRLALLARTFIKEAPLMLLDEPFHGLDASYKNAVRRIIDTIAARSGAAIVFVTHCPEEVPEGFTRSLRLPSR